MTTRTGLITLAQDETGQEFINADMGYIVRDLGDYLFSTSLALMQS